MSDHLNHTDREYRFPITRIRRGGSKLLRRIRTVALIARLGRSSDILFVNGMALEAALVNLAIRKPMVLKIVGDLSWELATLWGWTQDSFEDFQYRSHSGRLRILHSLQAWWTRRANKIIANSGYMASWAISWGASRENVVVVHNAAESIDTNQPIQSPLKTSFKLVTVSRLVPWKKVDEILSCISRIDGIGLIVIGDGPEKLSLERLATNLGLAQRVYFAGQRPRAETLSMMAGSDVFVLNSTWESFAHVITEAMALGLPVLATPTGGSLEQIDDGQNGLLISPEHRSLTDAIRLLNTDSKLRKRLGQQGKATARDRFSIKEMVDKTEEVLMKACKVSN